MTCVYVTVHPLTAVSGYYLLSCREFKGQLFSLERKKEFPVVTLTCLTQVVPCLLEFSFPLYVLNPWMRINSMNTFELEALVYWMNVNMCGFSVASLHGISDVGRCYERWHDHPLVVVYFCCLWPDVGKTWVAADSVHDVLSAAFSSYWDSVCVPLPL